MSCPQQLFAPLLFPVIEEPVDPDGPVVLDDRDETIVAEEKTKKRKWRVRIELHKSRSKGLWMWSIDWDHHSVGGAGYRVGEKWGKFCATRDSALHWAIQELKSHIDRDEIGCVKARRHLKPMLKWAKSIDPF